MAADPVMQFEKWWKEALSAEVYEANAMVLATAGTDGFPSARIVLLKEFSMKGFVFFTNYNSFKGLQIAENPKACLVFFWKELERQIRITGIVNKISEEENDAYFYSRPLQSQVGAVVSPQSHVIENRNWLDNNYIKLLADAEKTPVQRPIYWGGYMVKPVIIEFWQGRPGRLHDRLQYSLANDGQWKIERLAP
jgi:pyridoxamine 5'-phosphate oxidase